MCFFTLCAHVYSIVYVCYSGMPAYSAQCNICDNDQLADLHISPKITTTCDCLCVWSAVLSSWLTMLCSCLRSHSRTVLSHEAVTTLPLKAHVPTYIQIPNFGLLRPLVTCLHLEHRRPQFCLRVLLAHFHMTQRQTPSPDGVQCMCGSITTALQGTIALTYVFFYNDINNTYNLPCICQQTRGSPTLVSSCHQRR